MKYNFFLRRLNEDTSYMNVTIIFDFTSFDFIMEGNVIGGLVVGPWSRTDNGGGD